MRIHILTGLISFLFVNCLYAQETLEERIERIENSIEPEMQIVGRESELYNIEERMKELHVPGLSVAVVYNGEIEWAKGYGLADTERNIQVDIDTLFQAGSISKLISAIRALQLVEDGTVSLDVNINQYLKNWQVPDNEFTVNSKVTLRGILSHTAGLTIWGFPGYAPGTALPSVLDILDGKGNTEAVTVFQKPGKNWEYSGGGYVIMQQLINEVDETGFAETMQEHVLTPLKMNVSTFENPLPENLHEHAATGYFGNDEQVEGRWAVYPEMAPAGLWSTPSDLARAAIEIQRINQTNANGILQYKTVQDMLEPVLDNYGLGLSIDDHTFSHGGDTPGFSALLYSWKELPYAVIIMLNSENSIIKWELLITIARAYGLPGVEPTYRTMIDLSKTELEEFEGKYLTQDERMYIVKVKGDHLILSAKFRDGESDLYPENENIFFSSDGPNIFFEIKGTVVVGARIGDSEDGQFLEKIE